MHKRVIPELNEYGESVLLCDLRWGVNTEELDGEEGSKKIVSVCLDEIDLCGPYMLVLLGERAMAGSRNQRPYEKLKNTGKNKSERFEKECHRF